MYRNIPAPLAHRVYISQLILYSRACVYRQDFADRGLLLTRQMQDQMLLVVKFKSSLRVFYGRHHDLVIQYRMYESHMTTDVFVCRSHNVIYIS